MIDIVLCVMVTLALLFVLTLGYALGYKAGVKYILASVYTIISKIAEDKDTQD